MLIIITYHLLFIWKLQLAHVNAIILGFFGMLARNSHDSWPLLFELPRAPFQSEGIRLKQATDLSLVSIIIVFHTSTFQPTNKICPQKN